MENELVLDVATWIQGNEDDATKNHEINVMLVFQVNCPGCFTEALPVLEALLSEDFDVGFFAVSTAFEDFHVNTEANTRALVLTGQACGIPAKTVYAKTNGKVTNISTPFPFPVAFDDIEELDMSEQAVSARADAMVQQAMGLIAPGVDEQKAACMIRPRALELVREQRFRPKTFTGNSLRGTPSWIVFNRERKVLDGWVGHLEYDQIVTRIKAQLQSK